MLPPSSRAHSCPVASLRPVSPLECLQPTKAYTHSGSGIGACLTRGPLTAGLPGEIDMKPRSAQHTRQWGRTAPGSAAHTGYTTAATYTPRDYPPSHSAYTATRMLGQSPRPFLVWGPDPLEGSPVGSGGTVTVSVDGIRRPATGIPPPPNGSPNFR